MRDYLPLIILLTVAAAGIYFLGTYYDPISGKRRWYL